MENLKVKYVLVMYFGRKSNLGRQINCQGIGIIELKLDDSTFSSEVLICNYNNVTVIAISMGNR